MAGDVTTDTVNADTINDRAGSGAPNFPNGIELGGTAVEFDYEYDELDISSLGVFSAAQPVLRITRFNQMVTLSWENLAHSSASNATAGAAFIPASYRPPSSDVRNIYNHAGAAGVSRVIVASDGELSFGYVDWAGASDTRTATGPGSISWNIDGTP